MGMDRVPRDATRRLRDSWNASVLRARGSKLDPIKITCSDNAIIVKLNEPGASRTVIRRS